MGRVTHNKHTQSRIQPGKDVRIKTSTKVLSSLQSLKDNMDPSSHPQPIPHSNIFFENNSVNEIYKALTNFSTLSQGIVKQYEENEMCIKNQDQLALDMLHEFELGSPKDLYRAYKCYIKLRQSRQLRRKAKTENKMLAPLYGYIKSNPTLPKDMRNICEKCAGIQYDIEHSTYYYRTDLNVE